MCLSDGSSWEVIRLATKELDIRNPYISRRGRSLTPPFLDGGAVVLGVTTFVKDSERHGGRWGRIPWVLWTEVDTKGTEV